MTATVTRTGPLAEAELSAPADEDLDLLLLIRHFEQRLLELFAAGKLHGTTHTCLGQEYIPVALRPLVFAEDFVFSNHRGHGHYLARFQDPVGLLAEIMGRAGAICHGVGGSQHILRDRYLSTGVQGQSLPVAAGVALHLSRRRPGALALAYIGDGTWGEGAVYEALNMAALWRLPLMVVVEHNGIAQSTPTEAQLAGTISGRAAAFGIAHHRTESVDINAIRAALGPLMARVRAEREPLIAEFITHRIGPHSKGDDLRRTEEIEHARRNDWYARYRAAAPERFAAAEARATARVAAVVEECAARPAAVWSGESTT